jgi:hypothetical protein
MDKNRTNKENYRLIFLINIDTKISFKYLQSESNNMLKRSYSIFSWSPQRDARMLDSTQISKCNIAHIQDKGQLSHGHLNRCRKNPLMNIILFHDESPE